MQSGTLSSQDQKRAEMIRPSSPPMSPRDDQERLLPKLGVGPLAFTAKPGSHVSGLLNKTTLVGGLSLRRAAPV